jgi:TPR repeat protein
MAFAELKRLADEGEVDAFHMLAFLYDAGQGTRRNRQAAMRWYLRAYRAGSSISASNLATMYRGVGDNRREFEWYLRAAAMGDGDAKLEVAIRYLSGKGVRRSVSRAVGLLRSVLATKNTTEAAKDTARQLLHGCEVRRRRLTNGSTRRPLVSRPLRGKGRATRAAG